MRIEDAKTIYRNRGLTRTGGGNRQAAYGHDALGAHFRDELGISEMTTARPM
jgi:hypothetical protein